MPLEAVRVPKWPWSIMEIKSSFRSDDRDLEPKRLLVKAVFVFLKVVRVHVKSIRILVDGMRVLV